MKHRDLILDCLDDVDVGIRMRALDLVAEFVTRRTLRDISRILLRKLHATSTDAIAPPVFVTSSELIHNLPSASEATSVGAGGAQDPETPYREALAKQLLAPGAYVRGDGYPLMSSGEDFSWYIATVLGGLARTPGMSRNVHEIVSYQLIELISRVEAVRPATVAVAVALLRCSSSTSAVEALPVLPIVSGEQNLLDLDGSSVGEAGMINVGMTNASSKVADENISNDSGVTQSASTSPPSSSEPSSSPSASLSPPPVYPSVLSSQNPPSQSAITPGPSVGGKSEAVALSPFVVAAAAWVTGEHAQLLKNPVETAFLLIQYPVAGQLDGNAQVALIGACVKVYAGCEASAAQMLYQPLIARLAASLKSEVAEVYERSLLFKALVEQAGPVGNKTLQSVFDGKLLPVDPRAQAKVSPPDGLDLEQSLLDTGDLDLYSFLTQDDDALGGGEPFDDEDEDDLFRSLEQSGDLRLGKETRNGEGPRVVQVDKRSSPFYLSEPSAYGNGNANGSTFVRSSDPNSSDVDFLGLSGAFSGAPVMKAPVKVLKEDLPVGVFVDEDSGPVPAQLMSRGNSRFDQAFKGVFDPSTSNAESAGEVKSKRRRRKTRDLSSKKKIELSKAVNQNNLISFEYDAPMTDSVSGVPTGTPSVPKHLGGQTDLLLS
jgi:hypothetical protein